MVRVLLSLHSHFLNCRIRFPGFVIRVVCFDPNLQDQEGCTATPISTILPPGKRKRSASIVDHQFFSRSVDKAEGGELLEQFIQRMTPNSEQVNYKGLEIRLTKVL